MYDFKSEIAVLLNITPDHLDRYNYSFQNYINAKFRVIQNMSENDCFIYCSDDEVILNELKKIKRVIMKKIGREPDEILLVIDSNVGQNAKSQAEIFNDSIGVTGIILTKTDSTSKGGIVITIKNDLKIPIKLVTYGEKIENIDYFDPDEFVNEMIG